MGENGLLDFIKTPVGQGLLAATFGGLAGARRGAPLNNIGRAGLAGLTGYGQAAAVQDAKAEEEKRKATMQADVAAMEAALRGMPARTVQPLTPNDDEGNVNPAINMPAQPGSMTDFYRAALKASSPQFQQLGMQGLMTASQQEAELQRKEAERQRMQGEQSRILSTLQQAKTPQEALAAGVPADMVKTYFDTTLGKPKGVVINGQLVNPVTGEAIGSPIAPQVNPTQDLIIPDGKGGFVLNRPLVNAKSIVATASRAPAPERMITVMGANGEPISMPQSQAQGMTPYTPAAAAQFQKNKTKAQAKEELSGVVQQLNNSYDALEKGGGITSTGRGALSNLGTSISSSGVGQLLGGAFGTENQRQRQEIQQTRPLLLNLIKEATGMSAQQMNSNAEMMLYLQAATDPTLTVEANRSALANLDRMFGLGLAKRPEEAGKTAPTLPTQDAIAAEIARRRGAK